MNKFDESRVGYGQENPLIKAGVKGYFDNNYKRLRDTVENHESFVFHSGYDELKNRVERNWNTDILWVRLLRRCKGVGSETV